MSNVSKKKLWLRWSVVLVVVALLAACGGSAAPPAEEPAAAPEAAAPTEEAAAEPAAEPAAAEPSASAYKEAPMLAEKVAAGELPPVDERLPSQPLVLEPVDSVGKYGGTMRMMAADSNNHLAMTMGTENLVKWERDVSGIRPNVLESWEWNDDATELVVHFRQGIRWSDGEPFTANDYLFWWNDIVLDDRVGLSTPAGTRVNGEPMQLEKIDDYTLRYTFAGPNPLFLDLSARGFYHSAQHMVPAHYMKEYHPGYNTSVADATELLARYNNPNEYPGRPVLTAWQVVEFVSDDRIVVERNPYFWKVDTEGNQLPYIDRIEVDLVPPGSSFQELAVLKAIAGELDLQIRDFIPKDWALLQDNQEAGNYDLRFWKRGEYAWPWLILYYDYPDEGIVDLMYNQDFRKALSFAINRDRINEVAALGLSNPRQAALSPESPEFSSPEGQEVYNRWVSLAADYDLAMAESLLDQVGVVDADGDGFRDRPDGSPLELIISVDQGDGQSIDATALIKQDWEAAGLRTVVSPDEWSTFEQRVMAGEIMIRAWGSAAAWGLVSASPVWAPIEGVSYCMGGPRIGLWYQTGGREGIAPRPGSMIERLQERYTEVIQEVDPAVRDEKLLAAYEVHIEDGPLYIGTVGDSDSALIVNKSLRNVQDFGLVAGWDLGFPGTADPEQFYFEQ